MREREKKRRSKGVDRERERESKLCSVKQDLFGRYQSLTGGHINNPSVKQIHRCRAWKTETSEKEIKTKVYKHMNMPKYLHSLYLT